MQRPPRTSRLFVNEKELILQLASVFELVHSQHKFDDNCPKESYCLICVNARLFANNDDCVGMSSRKRT